MGRHSRKGPDAPAADTGQWDAVAPGTVPGPGTPAGPGVTPGPGMTPGTGRRRRGAGQQPQQTPGAYDTPVHGTPRHQGPADTSPHGSPRRQGPVGTPMPGSPRHRGPADTPTHGTPFFQGPYDTAADPFVRGGHPVHDERGASPARYPYPPAAPAAPFIPAPRREAPPAAEPSVSDGPAPRVRGRQAVRAGGLGRTLTGIAAAAVTTVLALVVAGQVAEREKDGTPQSRSADDSTDRAGAASQASRSDDRDTPAKPVPAAPPSYEQLMARQFPIDPKLKGPAEFEAVPGFDRAPGKGRKIRYRVDVEKGLGLDPALFAQAVQKTLNDRRSWAGDGEMTFERISSGEPQFVITLASPGTTGEWCRKSGLDTTIDNVSCDSASTQRVMINAFRWAQGSATFGPKAMHAYRQMLINHEVGHRLGHTHVSCRTPGALAPVMQQQTKSLDIDDIKCRPNPWVHPGS
ncbi:DUF3152 domain-containing protein [Streptomyces sp. NPDC094032]|uniref:DUF3152 domain-containing protein n=1 Tax=Streptomyces sp. NPDC094032 TaxID=3155308 RepID=UPI003327054C